MEAVARLRNVPTSPRKMRLVADMIRGLGVDDALNALKYTSNEPAGKIEKLVLSAISNWEVKNHLRPEDYDLFVKEISVDSAKMLKRFRPAPHGRAHRIRKRSNHVTLVLDSLREVVIDETYEEEEVIEDADVMEEEVQEVDEAQVEETSEEEIQEVDEEQVDEVSEETTEETSEETIEDQTKTDSDDRDSSEEETEEQKDKE